LRAVLQPAERQGREEPDGRRAERVPRQKANTVATIPNEKKPSGNVLPTGRRKMVVCECGGVFIA
jgi:hypothetical protein